MPGIGLLFADRFTRQVEPFPCSFPGGSAVDCELDGVRDAQ